MAKTTDAELATWEKTRDLNAGLLEAVDDIKVGRVIRHTVEPRSPVARARGQRG